MQRQFMRLTSLATVSVVPWLIVAGSAPHTGAATPPTYGEVIAKIDSAIGPFDTANTPSEAGTRVGPLSIDIQQRWSSNDSPVIWRDNIECRPTGFCGTSGQFKIDHHGIAIVRRSRDFKS